jgi:hypothetical protein
VVIRKVVFMAMKKFAGFVIALKIKSKINKPVI